MIGRTISHYTILEVLGEGAMGVVYKAEDTRLKRLVAIKCLPHHEQSNLEERMRFLREAQAASALNHPNICTVHDIAEVSNESLLIMELVEGTTLRDRIRKKVPFAGTIDDDEAQEIVRFAHEIASGLAAAHRKGIIHRDVKSENVMVTDEGGIKIMDFGLAKLRGMTTLTKTGSTVGTVMYMSPEQVQGEDVDHRTDIYSFGVMLFEMLTGRLPFLGEHEAAVIYQITNVEAPAVQSLRKGIHPELGHIVAKCLNKDRSKRFQSMDELVALFQRLRMQSVMSVPGPPDTTIAPVRHSPARRRSDAEVAIHESFVRRNKQLILILALTLALIGVMIVAYPSFAPGEAWISVASEPTGSLILLNGKLVGQAPLYSVKVAPGPVLIRAQKQMFLDKDTVFAIRKGETLVLKLVLAAVPPPIAERPSTSSRERVLHNEVLQPARTLNKLVERLATSLYQRSGLARASVVVIPFTYQDLPFGSPFSNYVKSVMEAKITEIGSWEIASGEGGWTDSQLRKQGQTKAIGGRDLRLSGTYWERAGGIEFVASLRDAVSYRVIATAQATLDSAELGKVGLPLKPANYVQAARDQKIFVDQEVRDDTMSLDIWTDKGREGLIYHKGERMQLHVRVDRPCYLRIIYHLADGRRALLDDNRRMDSSRINADYLYPTKLKCDAPFGIEVLQVLSRTERFESIVAAESKDGYTLLPHDLGDLLVQLRGMRPVKSNVQEAEKRLVLTTLEN